jgi:hypothetical protein
MALYALFCLMDPLHATIEEFAADGYTHMKCRARTQMQMTET